MSTPDEIPLEACPDYVSLSCFADLKDDPSVARHLQGCSRCRKTVEDYRCVNALLADAAEMPETLPDTIIAACRKLSRPRPLFLFSRYFWQGAAALLAVSTLLAAFLLQEQEDEVIAPREQNVVALAEPSAALPMAPAITENTGFSYHDQLKLNGKIEPDRLMTVSTRNYPYAATVPARRYHVGDSVAHIWLAADMNRGLDAIEELAGRLSAPVTWEDSPRGGRVASLRASDQDLQSLVNDLQRRQLVLVSPMYPQPFSEAHTAFSGKPVTYELTLLPKE